MTSTVLNPFTGDLQLLSEGGDGSGVNTVTGINGIIARPNAGNVILSLSGATIFNWTDQDTDFNVVPGNGYFITAGSVIAFLPASPVQGTTVSFVCDFVVTSGPSNAFVVQCNSGQYIRIGSDVSSATGITVNTHQGDSIELVYHEADSTWFAFTAPLGVWITT
jgi:hypothetical protein